MGKSTEKTRETQPTKTKQRSKTMSIIKDFNSDTQRTLINDRSCPWLGGVRGKFYSLSDGRIIAYLDRRNAVGTAGGVLAVVPEKWADKAEDIEYDPYHDAGYASESIDLVWRALSDAVCYQEEGSNKVISGNYPPAVDKIILNDYNF